MGEKLNNSEEKPLVSVIMPCYNHEKYVGQSIESVLNQTYDNIELIVLDHASTDASLEVIKQYEGKLKILHVDKNDQLTAEKILFENSTGAYIAYMTSDDVWKSDKLEKQMRALAENPSAKACFTYAEHVDEKLNAYKNMEDSGIFMEHNRTRYEWLERLLMEGNCLSYPSVVMERKIFEDVTRRMLPFRQLADMYKYLLILLKYDIYIVEEPLLLFRWHAADNVPNESSVTPESCIRTMNEMEVIREEIIGNMEDDVFLKAFKKYLRNENASSHEEIVCEKFFLFAQMKGQLAINYFYRQSKYMMENQGCIFAHILEKYYKYTFKDFNQYVSENGIGMLQTKNQSLENSKNEIEELSMQVLALQKSMRVDLDLEQREILYRRTVFEQLLEEQKTVINLMRKGIGKILLYAEGISDEGKYATITDVIRSILDDLHILLTETPLRFDKGIDREELDSFRSVKNLEVVTNNEFVKILLPFLNKIYSILQQYSDDI